MVRAVFKALSDGGVWHGLEGGGARYTVSGGLNESDGHGVGSTERMKTEGPRGGRTGEGRRRAGRRWRDKKVESGSLRRMWPLLEQEEQRRDGESGTLGPGGGPGKALHVWVSQRHPRPCLDGPPLPVGKDARSLAQCSVFPVRTGFSDLFIIFLGTIYVTLEK